MTTVFEARIQGLPPGFLMHNIDGGFVRSAPRREMERLQQGSPKSKKEPANAAKMQELEWVLGFYHDGADDPKPSLPSKVLRAGIHGAAKMTRDGQRVNRGLQVLPDTELSYGAGGVDYTGKTIDDLKTVREFRHEAAAKVGQAMVLRVRPILPEWSVRFRIRVDTELVNEADLRGWIEQAGRFIGIGDWRPDKGGEFGTFDLVEFTVVPDGEMLHRTGYFR